MHTDMTRVNAIWQHPLYQQNLKDLIHLEADRIFCRHTPEHFLDVARLAYIFALERGLNCSRELIYCTALLHDIGRVRQYMDGTPHDEAGVQIAEQILSDLAFSSTEKSQILTAIGEHRSSKEETSSLSRILYEADKKSRMFSLSCRKRMLLGSFKKKYDDSILKGES